MNTFVLILNSALVEDDDYAFLPNCEVDNSQVCNMEDVAEYSHDLLMCKVSGSTSSQIAFMHTYHTYSMLCVSVQKTQKKVFIRLKAFECLTHDCPDSGNLETLYQMLKTVEDKFRSLLPHQDGLLLRLALVTHTVTAAR